MRKNALALALVVTAVLGGIAAAAALAPPATTPQLTDTYSELATAILGTKRAESAIVKAICADAFAQASAHLEGACAALAAGDKDAAGSRLEMAAESAAMIATEGDKAVAAVRNRLLEGGHHHHATPEIAAKYDPGYVVVKKDAKKLLLEQAGEIGKLAGAVRSGAAGDAEVKAAGAKLAEIYAAALK